MEKQGEGERGTPAIMSMKMAQGVSDEFRLDLGSATSVFYFSMKEFRSKL